ncbi:hypothetical protein Tco_0496901 [Tanacetum coccineum]
MFLNVDQLEKQLDNDEFQEIGSMAAFRVLKTQFQKFIKSRISLDDEDSLMTRKYFLAYTGTEVQQFRDTLIKHMESVKKSINERALHKREYDIKVNERQMQTKEEKVDMSKALNARQQHAEQPKFDNKGEVDQNAEQSVKFGQHGQFLKAKSNEAKDKKDIDDFEIINVELEHSVTKLLAENEHLHKENEHLKQTYNDLYDSIKKTRVQTVSRVFM